jgi:type I restriction enzyme R subunit
MFRKISEEEMVIADQLKDMLRKTREALNSNFDKKDPEFISLYEELKRLFEKNNLDEITQEEMKANINHLQKIYDRVNELNRKNILLKAKYENDAKYARVHKRIMENSAISQKEIAIHETLMSIKAQADAKVLINTRLLENEGYFMSMMMPFVIGGFSKAKIDLDPDAARFINNCVAKEYMNEYQGVFS